MKKGETIKISFGNFKKHFKKVIFLIFIVIILFSSFYTVDAGERAVVLTLGKMSLIPSKPGFHFKIPLVQKVVKMDVRTQKYSAEASAASRDLQDVFTEVTVNYHLSPDETPSVYTDLKLAYEDRIIQPSVQEVVKAVTAQYTAEELITRRAFVKDAIQVQLGERLQRWNIVLDDVSITEFKFSVEFTKAIEAKVTAEQQKLKAERDLERIEIEAQQRIEQAKAEAEALKLQKQQLTSELVELRKIEKEVKAIEKWDGKLPQYVGAGATPFISLN